MGSLENDKALAENECALVVYKPCGIIWVMIRKPKFWFVCGAILVLISALGAAQLAAYQRFLLRGRVQGFPESRLNVEERAVCVNAALEQYKVSTSAPKQSGSDFSLSWALDMIAEGGFSYVRQRFPWSEIEPTLGRFEWTSWDHVVQETVTRELGLIAVLDTPPAWAGLPPDPQAFARFAARFAERYGDSITFYQIWHNPNLGSAWGGEAHPGEYAALLIAASDAIRGVDPDARIVLGSLAPTVEAGGQNYAEDLFLDMLYAAGAGSYFDIVAAQPYGFFTGPDDRRVSRDVLNFSRVILIRDVLEARGENDKAVWLSHLGWNSKPEAWPGPDSIWGQVDEDTQAAYTVEALARARREWPWAGLLCLNSFQPAASASSAVDAPTVMSQIPDAEAHWGFALVGPEGVPRPVYSAVRDWAKRLAATPGIYGASTPYATFEGTWTLGPQGADIGQSGDRVVLPFEGTGVALTVRRGEYRAFLFVTVDGKPAPALPRDTEGRAYVVLYDPQAEVVTVPLAESLPYGRHTVEVVAERGWGQWALVDWRVSASADTRILQWGVGLFSVLGAVGLVLVIISGVRFDWGRVGRRLRLWWEQLHEGARAVITFLVGAVYLFAAWQTLGQEVFRRLGERNGPLIVVLAAGLFYVSPWLVLTLVAGLLVSLIVMVQPSIGLALTMVAAPLYMHPLSLLNRSFSLAELVLLPTLVGCVLHIVKTWRESHDFRVDIWRLFFYPILLFVVIALVSTLFAQHQREALRELRLVVLEPVLFYVALVLLPMAQRERWRIVDGFVLSAALVAVVGLVQYFVLGDVITAEGGMRRLRSIYGSPNNVGLYLGRVLPFLIAMTLWGKAPRRWLYALALPFVGIALLLSLSRGALILGIPAALVALGVLAGPRWRRATLILMIVGMLAMVPLLRTPRFAGLLDWQGGTTGFRISLWRSTWRMILDHPILGVGLDNFLYAYRTRYVLPTAWEEFNLSHPHNVLMDFAARLGLVGLGAFVWMQEAFWRRVWSLREQHMADGVPRALILGVMASMMDFLAHGLVDAAYFVIDLAFVYFLSFAIVIWVADVPIDHEARLC